MSKISWDDCNGIINEFTRDCDALSREWYSSAAQHSQSGQSKKGRGALSKKKRTNPKKKAQQDADDDDDDDSGSDRADTEPADSGDSASEEEESDSGPKKKKKKRACVQQPGTRLARAHPKTKAYQGIAYILCPYLCVCVCACRLGLFDFLYASFLFDLCVCLFVREASSESFDIDRKSTSFVCTVIW